MRGTQTQVAFTVTDAGDLVISLAAVARDFVLAPPEVGRLARWLTAHEPPQLLVGQKGVEAVAN